MNHTQAMHRRGMTLRLATFCVAAATVFSAQAKEQTFEEAFSTRREPAALHYEVQVFSRGAPHHLEIWRDANRRLRRKTDGDTDLYAFKEQGDSDFRLSILDHKRHIHSLVDRTNLARLGTFTDWYDLGHGLRHPIGDYHLTPGTAPDTAPQAVADCQWYDLTANQRTSHICWSAQLKIPLMIMSSDKVVMWRVTAVDRKPIPAATFAINDAGYVRNDANEDIEND
ncbi:MAG: hypothetical protein QM639_20430 [Rhodocyclaceae bacterium]